MQGGDPEIVDDPSRLPHSRHQTRLTAPRAGYVTAIQCEQVGIASMMLGGGREKKEDSVDPAVGLVFEKKIGDRVEAGDTLCTVHYNLDARLADATELLATSFEIGPKAPGASPLVEKIIGARKRTNPSSGQGVPQNAPSSRNPRNDHNDGVCLPVLRQSPGHPREDGRLGPRSADQLRLSRDALGCRAPPVRVGGR